MFKRVCPQADVDTQHDLDKNFIRISFFQKNYMVKVKITLEQATKALWGSRGIALLFL
jgi:hypothetical protein